MNENLTRDQPPEYVEGVMVMLTEKQRAFLHESCEDLKIGPLPENADLDDVIRLLIDAQIQREFEWSCAKK